MEIVRALQALFVLWIGAFAALVALNNLVDYRTNFRFVQHVLSMDTTLPDSALRHRAIRSPAIHRAAYAILITAEAVTAGLCLWGAARLFGALDLSPDAFHEAKTAALAGLALGFAVWFGGFMLVGGQWFASWQSREWNGRESAFMFYTAIALVFLILLHKV